MNAHLGDEIELYALGDLAPEERLRIEEHLASCTECTRALGEAESTLGDLAGLLPAYQAPRRLKPARPAPLRRFAIAASFVAGLLVAGASLTAVEHRAGPSDGDARAQVAMLHSHFVHVPLAAVEPGAPLAKVIYPKDRSWLYAIVDDAGRPYRLVTVQGGITRDLGTLAGHGATSSLYVEAPGQVGEIDLLSGDQIVARGMLQ